ncbi:acetate/propionate family kinase [Kozakia baliensis]|uniref:acetate/propionate family kinase n=1 Tax=Kozakia baliensis TaxID=153496 RepID=UPI00345BEDF6
MAQTILTLNAGSSSIKFALFDAEKREPHRLLSGELEGIGERPHLRVKDTEGKVIADENWEHNQSQDPHDEPMAAVMRWLASHYGKGTVQAIGHRIVHGGPKYHQPVKVTPEIYDELAALTPFAPLHQPSCVGPIRAIMRQRPDLPQIACFDTAFHYTMPPIAHRIAVPNSYDRKGVRRYGFHGLSYEHIARRLKRERPELLGGRVLVAHVGNGASLCALRDGKSIATTMGFSVLDGMMMGTRCGHLDPGVLLYMLKEEHLSPDEVENLLYHHAGLLGVSGVSSDMRELRQQSDKPDVAMALELFSYRFAEQAGAMVMALGGLDTLIFTAGIGEHDAAFRQESCNRLAWMGIAFDEAANKAHAPIISKPESRVTVLVVPADEEASIFQHVQSVLTQGDENER